MDLDMMDLEIGEPAFPNGEPGIGHWSIQSETSVDKEYEIAMLSQSVLLALIEKDKELLKHGNPLERLNQHSILAATIAGIHWDRLTNKDREEPVPVDSREPLPPASAVKKKCQSVEKESRSPLMRRLLSLRARIESSEDPLMTVDDINAYLNRSNRHVFLEGITQNEAYLLRNFVRDAIDSNIPRYNLLVSHAAVSETATKVVKATQRQAEHSCDEEPSEEWKMLVEMQPILHSCIPNEYGGDDGVELAQAVADRCAEQVAEIERLKKESEHHYSLYERSVNIVNNVSDELCHLRSHLQETLGRNDYPNRSAWGLVDDLGKLEDVLSTVSDFPEGLCID